MAAPKLTPQDLAKLYSKSENTAEKESILQDKKYIEAMKNRLDKLLQNPIMAKKAALIIENMINHKQKK